MELLGELLEAGWPLELSGGGVEGRRPLELLGKRLEGWREGKLLVSLLKSLSWRRGRWGTRTGAEIFRGS